MINAEIRQLAGEAGQSEFLDYACEIIVAFLNKNPVAPSDVPVLIREVHATLTKLFGTPPVGGMLGVNQPLGVNLDASVKPAVDIRESVTPHYIVCLEDGKRLKTLKRYIRGRFDLSPEQYRLKWNLPPDYPMVAPSYAEKRSKLAKQFGLGQSRKIKRRRKER